MEIRNLAEIRARDPKLYEALSDIITASQNITQQVNGNPNGQPAAPPKISALRVVARDGYATVAIQDDNEIYRGISYYVDHADNAQFTNPTVVYLGDSRNVVVPIGRQTRYFRAYSAYPASSPSEPVYFGGAQPTAVSAIDTTGGPGPDYSDAQGSGTGAAATGLSGPGPVPFRSTTGVPPTR